MNAAPTHDEQTIAQKVVEHIAMAMGNENRWQGDTPYGTDLGYNGI